MSNRLCIIFMHFFRNPFSSVVRVGTPVERCLQGFLQFCGCCAGGHLCVYFYPDGVKHHFQLEHIRLPVKRCIVKGGRSIPGQRYVSISLTVLNPPHTASIIVPGALQSPMLITFGLLTNNLLSSLCGNRRPEKTRLSMGIFFSVPC